MVIFLTNKHRRTTCIAILNDDVTARVRSGHEVLRPNLSLPDFTDLKDHVTTVGICFFYKDLFKYASNTPLQVYNCISTMILRNNNTYMIVGRCVSREIFQFFWKALKSRDTAKMAETGHVYFKQTSLFRKNGGDLGCKIFLRVYASKKKSRSLNDIKLCPNLQFMFYFIYFKTMIVIGWNRFPS